MEPTIVDGQRVTAIRRWRRPRVGDVVVAVDPTDHSRLLVKRVRAVDAERVELGGDNATFSTDSRDYGPVPISQVRWIVLNSSIK